MTNFDFEHLPFGLERLPSQFVDLSDVVFNHLPYLAIPQGDTMSALVEKHIADCFNSTGRVNFEYVANQVTFELFVSNVANSIECQCAAIERTHDVHITTECKADMLDCILDAFCGYICTNVCTDQDLADYVFDCYDKSELKGCNYTRFAGVIISDVTRFLCNLADCNDGFGGGSDLMIDFTDCCLDDILWECIGDNGC